VSVVFRYTNAGKPSLKVSWQVTGTRQDAYAKAHPVIVEQDKSADERGLYLNPVENGQPADKGMMKIRTLAPQAADAPPAAAKLINAKP